RRAAAATTAQGAARCSVTARAAIADRSRAAMHLAHTRPLGRRQPQGHDERMTRGGPHPELASAAQRWARARADRWAPVPEELDRAVAADAALAEVARSARRALLRTAARRIGDTPAFEMAPAFEEALLRVPRERFVLPEDIGYSAEDMPLP